MSNAIIGALRVVLGMDSAAFNDGVGAAQKRLNAFRKNMQRTGRSLTRAGNRMSIGLTGPLVGLAYKSVAAQKEQERAIASVSAALESMGDGAGYTLSQLEAMAAKLQDKSLYGDEQILSKVTANLLTFGNIQGEVFERAQQVAIDLSARLGQDLQSSAVMLGKALNDPVQGLTALTRVGVSFTEEQKKQIKAMAEVGDTAGAQALMLAELERQYSGQAEALANTDSGKITQAMNSISDATEKVGAIVLPILADIAAHAKAMAERFEGLSPQTQKFIVVAAGLAAAIGPIVTGLGLMLTALAPMAGMIMAVVSPLGLLLTAATAAGVAIYSNWETLKEDFPAITGAVELALSGLGAAFGTILETGRSAFEGLQDVVRLVASGVESVMSGQFKDALWRGVEAVQQFGVDVLIELRNLLADVVTAALELGRNLVDGIKQGLQEKWQGLKDTMSGMAQGIIGLWKDETETRSPSRVFQRLGGYIVDGLVKGISGGVSLVENAVGQLSGALQLDLLKSQGQETEGVFQKIGNTATSVFGKMGRLIGEGVRGAKSFKDVLGGVLSTMGNVLLKQSQTAMSGLFGGSGSIGGSLVSGIFGGLLGFANGGSFDVGGAGGIDSQVVAFRASPNERVHITKPGQELGGGMGGTIVLDVRSDPAVIVEIAQNETGLAIERNNAARDEAFHGKANEAYSARDFRKR